MKHIVSFSGGKDSTAMLLMMLEKNMPIDEIIFCDTGKKQMSLFGEMMKRGKEQEYALRCSRGARQTQQGNDSV